MTFDPFGDFATRGYLRNLAGEKDLEIVRRLEHTSFITGIDAAFRRLAAIKRLSYEDVLGTHKVLFEAVYPWAGQDRLQTAPELAVANRNIGRTGIATGTSVLARFGKVWDSVWDLCVRSSLIWSHFLGLFPTSIWLTFERNRVCCKDFFGRSGEI